MYVHANPNPNGLYVEDCVVRAIAIATDRSWDDIYIHLCLQGYIMKNMPSVNKVWGTYLSSIGFENYSILDTCPDCYNSYDSRSYDGYDNNSYARGGYGRGNMGRSMNMQYGRPMSYGRNGMNGMSGRRYYDGEKDKAMNDLRRMMTMEQDPEKQAMIESAIHALEMK